MRPRRPTGLEVRTVLLLHYQMPLGCCVHATPIFAAVKAARPSSRLIVATRGLGAETFRHDPHIDVLIETSDPRGSLGALRKTASELIAILRDRGESVDLVLQPATDRAGSFALLALLLRLAPTVGFANLPELYDTYLAYNSELSLIDNNLRLVGARSPHREPAVYFVPRELAEARALLLEANPAQLPVCAFVMQGSGGQSTGWHADRFASVIQHVEVRGYETIFLGTQADEPRIQSVLDLAGSSGTSLAGRTTIAQLSALLTQCDLLVSIDTGTMHVGRAAGVPMVVLGPSWQRPIEWLPLQVANARVLRGQDRSEAPPGYQLDEIQTADVIEAINNLSTFYPPSQESRESRAQRLLSNVRA